MSKVNNRETLCIFCNEPISSIHGKVFHVQSSTCQCFCMESTSFSLPSLDRFIMNGSDETLMGDMIDGSLLSRVRIAADAEGLPELAIHTTNLKLSTC